MTSLDEVLERVLAERADDAPDAGPVVRSVLTTAPARTRQRRLVAGAAGVVAAAVVAVVAALLPGRAADPGPTPAQRPDTQDVVYRGVELTVPASWSVGSSIHNCPGAVDVLRVPPGTTPYVIDFVCLADPRPVYVEMETWRSGLLGYGASTIVDGIEALQRIRRATWCPPNGSCLAPPPSARGAWTGALLVPSRHALVTVHAPDRQAVRDLLNSVHVLDLSGTQVPDVVGVPHREAVATLVRAGLAPVVVDISGVDSQPGGALDPGQPPVAATIPAPGHDVAARGVVRVYLHQIPLSVPD